MFTWLKQSAAVPIDHWFKTQLFISLYRAFQFPSPKENELKKTQTDFFQLKSHVANGRSRFNATFLLSSARSGSVHSFHNVECMDSLCRAKYNTIRILGNKMEYGIPLAGDNHPYNWKIIYAHASTASPRRPSFNLDSSKPHVVVELFHCVSERGARDSLRGWEWQLYKIIFVLRSFRDKIEHRGNDPQHHEFSAPKRCDTKEPFCTNETKL